MGSDGPATNPMAPPDAMQPGTVLGGRYRLVRVLGEGGMGLVYEAMHERLRQAVAVKVLLPRLLDNAEVVARFEREARAASQLRGPNVARVMDVDVSESGAPYMVMELLQGHDIAQELRLRGSMPWQEAVGYVGQACSAMIEAHAAGIVHRDLKPSNLFLQPEGDERVVKVLDFGISKLTHDDESNVTMTYSTIGTPLYMSPEQVRSAKHVDARTDEWALGVILFELIAGRPPFTGGPTAVSAAIVADDTPRLRDFAPDVPPELEQVIERALRKKAADRYPDVAAFADALSPFSPEDSHARRRMRSGQSGGHRSVPPPNVVQIKVDMPTLPAAQLPRDMAELATISASDPRASQAPVPRSGDVAAAMTAAPISPPASLATDASWSRSPTGGRGGGAPIEAAPRRPRLLVLAAIGASLVAVIVVLVAVRSGPKPAPAAAPPTSAASGAPTVSAGTYESASTAAPLASPASSPVAKPTVAPPEPTAGKPAGPKPTAKPSASPPPAPKPTVAPPAGPDLPVHL